jgi:23S rRNA (guanine745-N1)-methyltransferase
MSIFICPQCKSLLERQNRSLLCRNKHCFDIAKEGYVNLLPVNAKNTKDPGDNSKMMLARRSFLETGHYDPLAKKLSGIIETLNNHKDITILDLGCGEGYYTGFIKRQNQSVHMFGLDISKVAVRYASKRYKDVIFCVASSFDIPLADHSLDIVLKNYAPSSGTELLRVIKEGGHFITVTPGERHLYQIRDIIYNKVLSHGEEAPEIQGFEIQDKINLKYTLQLEELESVKNLLEMTPFGWKIKEEDRLNLFTMNQWLIECDFNITIYKK